MLRQFLDQHFYFNFFYNLNWYKIYKCFVKHSGFTPDKEFDMKKFYNRTGHDLNEMMKSCMYQGQSCSQTKDKMWREVSY